MIRGAMVISELASKAGPERTLVRAPEWWTLPVRREAGNHVLGFRTLKYPADAMLNPLRVIERRILMICTSIRGSSQQCPFEL